MKHRSPEAQEFLNNVMRRKDVLEYIVSQALISEPATPEEVESFLKEKAPPEVFVLLEELTLDPAKTDEPMLTLVVGLMLRKPRHRRTSSTT